MRGLEQTPWLYDACLWLLEATGLKAWRKWLAAGARGRTLDLGCGTGRSLPLLPPGVSTVGVDPCAENLLVARRRAPGVPLVRASGEALPFRDGAFQTVLTSLVLCSVPDPRKGLGEIRRVLAPGGELRSMDHVRAQGRARAWFQDLIAPAWRCVTGGCNPNRDTEATVAACGFEIDRASRKANGLMRRYRATVTR